MTPPAPPLLPRGARVLDGVTILLGGLGLLFAITGGPRFTLAGIPVSMASGARPLLLAMALAAVRHAIVRRDPLHRRLLRAIERRPRGAFFTRVLPVFLVTRIVVLVAGYLAVRTIGFAPLPAPLLQTRAGTLTSMMLRWDANWYYEIAQAGYRYAAGEAGQQNIAFFPAYPLLMRYLGMALGRRLIAAGLAVSLLAFLGALVYLYHLGRRYMDDDRAAAAVVLLASYPFALFYGAVYTESLYLLGVLGAVYHLSRGESGRAAAWGCLVGLTRANGLLVSLPLVVIALQPALAARTPAAWRWLWIATAPGPQAVEPIPARAVVARVLAAAAPIAGLAAYWTYLWGLTGDPFSWLHVQATWGRTFQGIAGVSSGPFRELVEFGVLASLRAMPLDTLNSLAAVLAIAAIWPVTRRFGAALGLLVAVSVTAPLAAGGVMSMGRFTAVVFPIFLWLGAAVPARQRTLWVFAFGALQAFAAALFFTWREVF